MSLQFTSGELWTCIEAMDRSLVYGGVDSAVDFIFCLLLCHPPVYAIKPKVFVTRQGYQYQHVWTEWLNDWRRI
jgi:hypothetical protein